MPGIWTYLSVFFIAMVPVVELRGAIPFGVFSNIDIWVSYALAVAGSSVIIPIVIKFTKEIFTLLRKWKVTARFINWLEGKTVKKIDQVKKHKYVLWGLFVFVAIPLPGTGAWTGSMIAAFLQLRIREAMPAIVLGNIVAGAIMILLSYYLKIMIL